jgi:hypothetical protein
MHVVKESTGKGRCRCYMRFLLCCVLLRRVVLCSTVVCCGRAGAAVAVYRLSTVSCIWCQP